MRTSKAQQTYLDLSTLALSIRSRYYFTKREKTLDLDRDKAADEPLNKSVEQKLELLDMRKYYPQKLKIEDVTKLSESDFNISKKPTIPSELPWYFFTADWIE